MNRRGTLSECLVYTKQYVAFLLNENILKIIFFPVIAMIINIWIGKDMYLTYNSTETVCFVIICEAIWCGLFHSILNIVKEKKNIKRDNMAGVRTSSYFTSRAMIEFFVCAVQSVFFALSIWLISVYHDLDYIKKGIVISNPTVELYISILLVMYAADTLGLLISSVSSGEIKASQLAPYVLMAELVFSGNLFDLDGVVVYFSKLMVSRWGTEALGTTLNIEVPEQLVRLDYAYSSEHLLKIWLVLIVVTTVQLLVGNIMLNISLKKYRI